MNTPETRPDQSTPIPIALDAIDDGTDEAAARFESNRRYDHRPAIENVDRPTLVLTTRDQPPPKPKSNAKLVALLCGLVVGALALGAYLGRQGQPIANVNPDNAVASPSLANDAQAAVEPLEGDTRPPATVVSAPETSQEPAEAPVEAIVAPTVVAGAPDESAFLAKFAALDLEKLAFVPGEVDLTGGGMEALDRLTDLLLAYPSQPVELRVRTYSESTPGRNHGLSLHQSNALLTKLEAAGVGTDRLTIVGLGSIDTDRPTAAAALFLDAANSDIGQQEDDLFPLIIEEPFAGSFDQSSVESLVAVSAKLGDSPVSLVGYAWSEPTAEANHELSHAMLDAAAAVMISNGIPASQIETVGLGSAAASLAQRTTVVTAVAGPTAAIAVSLGAIPVDAVSFEEDSAVLTSSGRETLTSIAAVLTSQADIEVEIAVHYYQAATSQGNHDVSRQLADSIGDYLADAGVALQRLRLVAHGDPPHFAVPGRSSAVTFTVIR